MLVDTHAHLQWGSFDKVREKVISRARAPKFEIVNHCARMRLNLGFIPR